MPLIPSLYVEPGLSPSQVQNTALVLIKFYVVAQTSNLSRSLCKASLFPRESMGPPSLDPDLYVSLEVLKARMDGALTNMT